MLLLSLLNFVCFVGFTFLWFAVYKIEQWQMHWRLCYCVRKNVWFFEIEFHLVSFSYGFVWWRCGDLAIDEYFRNVKLSVRNMVLCMLIILVVWWAHMDDVVFRAIVGKNRYEQWNAFQDVRCHVVCLKIRLATRKREGCTDWDQKESIRFSCDFCFVIGTVLALWVQKNQ